MTAIQPISKEFSFFIPISKAVEDGNGALIVDGPLSESRADLEGQRMDMPSLRKGLNNFHSLGGPVDWNHLYERTGSLKYICGEGFESYDAPHPKTGETVPWLKTKLLKGKSVVNDIMEHMSAGGKLGYSVAGMINFTDPNDRSKIINPVITSVAITPTPVVSSNTGCLQLLKALGSAQIAGWEELRDIEFPQVPELQPLLQGRLYRSMTALQDVGARYTDPGVSAVTVEDLDGSPVTKKKRRSQKPTPVVKALGWAIALTLERRIEGLSQ